MAKRQNITIGIEFDVKKQQLRSLQQQLTTISKMSAIDVMAATGGKDISKASTQLRQADTAAKQVASALKTAFNAKLNTTNIQVFKRELQSAGLTLADVRKKFQAIGPQGEIAFAKLQNQIYKVGQASRQAHGFLDKMGKTLFNSIKWSISSSLVNSFTGSIQQAWGFAKSLDGSLNDIRIVTGKSADEMSRFADRANAAAKGLGRTTTDYTKASLIFVQQGLKDSEVQAKTDITLKTANVTGQSAEAVSEELTAVWNGYKVSAEEAELYVDRLAAIASTTASNLKELASGMSKVASAAASLGVGEDQLAAQLSTIISVTRQAPESVGTALKTMYARITDIKAGVEEDGTTLGVYSGKLAEMGINVLDASGQLRNMGTVIEEVGNKWSKFSEEQQIYIAQTMAGQRQYSNLIALFNNFDKYNEAMSTAGKAAGTLQEQQSVYLDSVEAHTNQLTASTQKLWKSMIDSSSMKKLMDFLSGLMESLAWIVDTLGGGGNLLLMLGSIATNVFSKQMTAGIATTLYNFDQAKSAAADYKATIADLDLQISKLGDSEEDKSIKDNLIRKKQIAQANRLGYMPQESLNELAQSSDKIRVYQATLLAAKKAQDEVKKSLQELFGKMGDGDTIFQEVLDGWNGLTNSTGKAKEVLDTVTSYLNNSNNITGFNSTGILTEEELKKARTNNLGGKRYDLDELLHQVEQQKLKIISQREQMKQTAVTDADKQQIQVLEKKIQLLDQLKNAYINYRPKQEDQKSIAKLMQLDTQLESLKAKAEELDKGLRSAPQELSKEEFEEWSKKLSQYKKVLKEISQVQKQRRQILFRPIEFSGPQESAIRTLTQLRSVAQKIKEISGNESQIKFVDDETQKKMGDFINKYSQLKKALSNPESVNQKTMNGYIADLRELLDAIQPKLEEGEKRAKAFREQLQNGVNANNNNYKQQAEAALEAEVDRFRLKLSQLDFQNVAEGITQITQGMTHGFTLMNQIKNLGSIWGKDNISGGQKFLKTLMAITTSLTTMMPVFAKNIKQITLYRKAKDKQAEANMRSTGTTVADTGAKIANEAVTKKVGKAMAGFIVAAGPWIAIISVIAGAVLGLVQAVGQYNAELIKARTERNKEAVENINKTLEEINKQRELYQGLKDLAQQYEQGTLSKNDLKEKTIELCKQYDLESDAVKGLITDYGKLNEAVLEAQKIRNQEAIRQAKSKRNIGLYELLSSQQYQHKGNQYAIDLNAEGSSQSALDFYESMGWTVKNGQISLRVDYNDLDAIARTVATAFETYEKAAGQGFQNQKSYEGLRDYVKYAKQHLGEAVIEGQQQVDQGTIHGLVLDSFGNGVKSQEQYTKAYNAAVSKASENPERLGLNKEQIEKAIEKELMTNFSDNFIQYQNVTDFMRRFGDIEGVTENYIKTLLQKFPNISVEDVLEVINPEDITKSKELEKTFENIYKYKKLTSETPIFDQESIDKYNNYKTATEKISKGNSLTKKEKQALGTLDSKIEERFIYHPDGSVSFEGNSKEWADYVKKQNLSQFSEQSNLLREKRDLLEKSGQKKYISIEVQNDQFSKKKSSLLGDKDFQTLSKDYTKRSDQQAVSDNYYKKVVKFADILSSIPNLSTENLDKWVSDRAQYAEKHLILNSKDDLENLSSIIQQINIGELDPTDQLIAQTALKYGQSYQVIKENGGKLLADQLGLDSEGVSQLLQLVSLTPQGKLHEAQIQKWQTQLLENNTASFMADFLKIYFNIKQNNFGDAAKALKEKTSKELVASDLKLYESVFGQDSDLTQTNIYKFVNVLRQSVKTSDDLSDSLENNQTTLKDLSQQALRFDNGIQDFTKNAAQWGEAISQGSYLSIDSIRDAYADIAGIQEDILTTDFLMDENNFKLMQEAILNNNEEAYKQWNENLIKSINFQEDKTTQVQEAITGLQNLSAAAERVGDNINIQDTTWVKDILTEFKAQGKTIQQATAYFNKALGLDIHIVQEGSNGQFRVQQGTQITKAADYNLFSKWRSSEALSSISTANKRIVKEVTLTKLIEKEVDLYHDINIELGLIDRKLSRLQKLQKNLSGAELLSNLQQQTQLLGEQNQKLKEKQQIQRQDLMNQGSILRGLGITFNADGSIANYASAYGSAIHEVADIQNQIRALETSTLGLDKNSTTYTNIQDQIEILQNEQKKRNEYVDRIEKYVSKYDTGRNNLFDLVDKIEDSARQVIELNLKAFQAKVQVKLDLTQAKKDWDHFVSETLNREDILNPNAFKTRQNAVELAFKDINYFDEDYKNRTEEFNRYKDEVNKFQQAKANGGTYQSELFNSESEAIAAAEQAGKKLQEIASGYADSLDTIKQAIIDAYEDVSEIFSKNNEIYSFIKNQLNHDIQLVDLLQGSRGGRLKDTLYGQINQTNLENIKQLRAQADYWANENAKATDEATRKLTKQKWRETIQALNAATEQGIQNLKTKYENLIDTIAQQMQDKLTNGKSLDYFQMSWDYVKERANSFLDPVNAAFAIKDTRFNYQKAINETQSVKAQQQLKKVMDQELKILKQKDKLTQYDVDRANKVLEIEKARLALEQARNNKTTLRLKRDSQGNYSYQFTADQQSIEEAQNKLDKAKNDLYNLDLKAYYDNADKVLKLVSDTKQKITDIMHDSNLSEADRLQKLSQVRKNFQEQFTLLTRNNVSIRNNLMQSAGLAMRDVFTQGQLDFEQMIDGFNGPTQQWINEMALNPDSAFNIILQGIKEMEQASKDCKDKTNEYLVQSKSSYNDLKTKGVDPLVESEKLAVDNVDTLMDKINEITTNAQSWKTSLGTVASGFDAIKDSAKYAGDAILAFKKILAGEDGQGGTTTGNKYGNSAGSGKKVLPGNYATVGGSGGSVTTDNSRGWFFKIPPKNTTNTFDNLINLNKVHGYVSEHSIQGHGVQESLKGIIKNIDKDNKEIGYSSDDINKSRITFLEEIHAVLKEKNQQKNKESDGRYTFAAFKEVFSDEKQNTLKYYYDLYQTAWMNEKKRFSSLWNRSWNAQTIKNLGMKFDTGGYTGSWNSSQGKLAILHEKELILNQADTKNMLKMLEITRDNQIQSLNYSSVFTQISNKIMSMIQELTSTKMLNDFNSAMQRQLNMLGLQSQINKAKQEIQQKVSIDANFPNVNSKEEIQEAFTDLVNLAAQRALRLNKY